MSFSLSSFFYLQLRGTVKIVCGLPVVSREVVASALLPRLYFFVCLLFVIDNW